MNEYIAWVKEKPKTRTLKIEIEAGDRYGDNPEVKINIFAYDYELQCGQHVQSLAKVNLEAKKEQQERDEYEKLKNKYGGAA